MERNLKISVVLPVYNCEKYIARSIESVLGQTYDNWELIIVNDGSKDSSEKIVRKFTERDKRIKLINQKNQGVSVARNLGIDEAIGDILMFLDADDWFEEDAFEEVVINWDDSVQMLLFDYYDVPEKGRKQYRKLFKEDKIEFGENSEYTIADLEVTVSGFCVKQRGSKVLIVAPWAKAFRIDYIKQRNLEFPVGIYIGEDQIFNLKVIIDMKRVLYLSKPIYDYYININSVSNVSYEKGGERLVPTIIQRNKCAKEILLRKKEPMYETAYYKYVFEGIKAILYWTSDEKEKDKKVLGRNYCYSQVKEVKKHMCRKYSFTDKILIRLCSRKCFGLVDVIVSMWKKGKKLMHIR